MLSDDSWQKFKSFGSNGKKKEETVTHLMTASGEKPFSNVSSSNIPLSTNLLRLCDNIPPKALDSGYIS